jgi:hypothetical protein
MTKTLLLVLALAAAPAAAQTAASAGDPMAGSGPFSSPEFQDMMETSDGYLAPENTMKVRSDFGQPQAPDLRDAPVSAPLPSLKTPAPAAAKAPVPAPARIDREIGPAMPGGQYKVTFAGDKGPLGSHVWPMGEGSRKYAREYVFVSVRVTETGYDAVLARLEKQAGFRFAGEKNYYLKSAKRTALLGWAPADSLKKMSAVKGVAGVAVEKKSSGMPLRTRVRFTLKVPFQNRPASFVPDFIKRLGDEKGFAAENWFRLPQKDDGSKFTMFDVTGVMPVEAISELSRSPFVASVEFKDPSL